MCVNFVNNFFTDTVRGVELLLSGPSHRNSSHRDTSHTCQFGDSPTFEYDTNQHIPEPPNAFNRQ